MKNSLFSIVLFVLSLVFLQSQAWSQETANGFQVVTNFKNNPLPQNPASLKILGIGNSFTEDGMQYLPDLLENTGIENVTLGKLTLSGCSLERHYQLYISGDSAYKYRKSYPGKNTWENIKEQCTFREAVADENWDIVIIQQVSAFSGMYETYQPYLNDLIDAILLNCSNAGVCLGWQMTWAYGTDSDRPGFVHYNRDQMTMYWAIIKTVKTMIADTGIDIIIPSGTAIQNLRVTRVNNPPSDLTRDGYHCDFGAGRYTLACTWFQTLIAPCLGTTIAENSFRTSNGEVPVDDDNFNLCQQAAQYACAKRFEITLISEYP
ncbi:MAG: DUF4886 domain-containing protein [Mangrovibacterium sp.]